VDLEGGGFCHIPPPYFFSPYFGWQTEIWRRIWRRIWRQSALRVWALSKILSKPIFFWKNAIAYTWLKWLFNAITKKFTFVSSWFKAPKYMLLYCLTSVWYFYHTFLVFQIGISVYFRSIFYIMSQFIYIDFLINSLKLHYYVTTLLV
jgi:hypothetical protein